MKNRIKLNETILHKMIIRSIKDVLREEEEIDAYTDYKDAQSDLSCAISNYLDGLSYDISGIVETINYINQDLPDADIEGMINDAFEEKVRDLERNRDKLLQTLNYNF